MPGLADLQREFAAALRDPRRPPPVQVRGPGFTPDVRRFDVHRNNMTVSLVEALEASYPAVRRLVGEEYFSAVAREFVREHPPRSPVLLHYGSGFGDFLEAFPSAVGVPYLGDVARLEWARVVALHAADAEPDALTSLAGIPERDLEGLLLRLHPSLTLVSSRWPVASLWRACCEAVGSDEVRMDEPQQVAVLRPAWQVTMHTLPAGCAGFARLLQRGLGLGEAATRLTQGAGERHPDFDLADALGRLFGMGAVAAMDLPPQHRSAER
jgi:hypothetical protein